MDTQKIGRSGELLVQYRLLRQGIDSALMTTDSGIDLVAYGSQTKKSVTIQIKTNLRPKKSGGKGKLALGFWIEDNSPADLIAFVDLSSESIWLFTNSEISKLSQQHSNGRYQLYYYVDESVIVKAGERKRVSQFNNYRLENRITKLLN